MTDSVESLRNKHRAQRALLSEQQLKANAIAVSQTLMDLDEYNRAEHIAAYIAIRGEISVEPVMHAAAASKCFYLPVLRGDDMYFCRWTPGQELVKKRFGLLEPSGNEIVSPDKLNMVLVPLVVFDDSGNRIGQGGGYYDRTFAFTASQKTAEQQGPVMIGVAHDCQRETQLRPQPWDIGLDKVVTEARVYAR